MYLTFTQFLLEKLSQEQPPGTSDLGGNGSVRITGASPRTVPIKPDQTSKVISGTSPEQLFGKKRQKK